MNKTKALKRLRTWEDDTHLHCGHFRSSAENRHAKNKCIYCDTNCTQCGGDVDLLAQFTNSGVCGKCARRNHKNI